MLVGLAWTEGRITRNVTTLELLPEGALLSPFCAMSTLFIVEGDSAAGSLTATRVPAKQSRAQVLKNWLGVK